MLTHSYAEMIEEGILALGEKKGSSRQALWKSISSKYPDADYKHFAVRLRKLREGGIIAQTKGKFRLEMAYKMKLLKALEKGKTSVGAVSKGRATMKKGAKASGSAVSKKSVKQAKKARKSGAVAKRSGKKGAKAGKRMSKASSAGKKSGAGKKTTGSKKTQQKKASKKTTNNKKAQNTKAKNSRKGAAAKKGGKVGKPAKGGVQSKQKKQVAEAVVDDAKVATPKSDRTSRSARKA